MVTSTAHLAQWRACFSVTSRPFSVFSTLRKPPKLAQLRPPATMPSRTARERIQHGTRTASAAAETPGPETKQKLTFVL